MAGSTRIPKAELTGIYGAMVKRMSRKMFGQVPEPLGVAWHNRKALNFSFSFGRKAQKWDQCDENLKSFAHMAVAPWSAAACAWTSATSWPTTRGSTRPRPGRSHAGASRTSSRRWSAT